MTLDTVICGCVTYYLESDDGLNSQRVDMLATCLDDLSGLLPALSDEAGDYFEQLRMLARLLLAIHHRA